MDCWAKVFPFVICATKQPISAWVELEKMRRTAWPSKSGIFSAIGGIPATSLSLMGMMPSASIDLFARTGQALSSLA